MSISSFSTDDQRDKSPCRFSYECFKRDLGKVVPYSKWSAKWTKLEEITREGTIIFLCAILLSKIADLTKPEESKGSEARNKIDDKTISGDILFLKTLQRFQFRCIVLDGCNISFYKGRDCFDVKDLLDAAEFFYKRHAEELRIVMPEWRLDNASSKNRSYNNVANLDVLHRLDEARVIIRVPGKVLFEGQNVKKTCCYDDNVQWQTRARNDGVVISNDRFRDLFVSQPNNRLALKTRLVRFKFGNAISTTSRQLGRDRNAAQRPNVDKASSDETRDSFTFRLDVPHEAIYLATFLPSWVSSRYTLRGREGRSSTCRDNQKALANIYFGDKILVSSSDSDSDDDTSSNNSSSNTSSDHEKKRDFPFKKKCSGKRPKQQQLAAKECQRLINFTEACFGSLLKLKQENYERYAKSFEIIARLVDAVYKRSSDEGT